MKYSVFVISIIFGIALSFGSASADFKKDRKNCRVNIFNPGAENIIPACTNLILSNRFSGRRLERVFRIRGFSYYVKNQYDKAIQDFDQAIRLNPQSSVFDLRGVSYSKIGEHRRAIQDFDQAIRLEPDNAYNFINRGFSYEALGQREQALRDYKKSYDLGDRSKRLIEKLRKHGRLP